ncbi:MAG: hypothetical protein HZB30_04960 [Nitrospirae bacterium]|nr:hypothetical protein [Nitrospirota bacterium]
MTLSKITEILEATVIVRPADLEDLNIRSACSADLMSDVLYYHSIDSLLITGLTQINVIRTAEIAGTKAIVFVLNKKPDERTVELAGQKKIPLLSTPFCMYTASGKLYQAGLRSSLND